MAKIFLKGLRDPLFLNDIQAEPLKDDWENKRLPALVRLGGLSTVRSEDIKGIFLDNETKKKDANTVPCGVEKCEGGCHWIIVRDDGRAIWKQPYQTKAMAQAEFSFENLSGYHLEHRFGR